MIRIIRFEIKRKKAAFNQCRFAGPGASKHAEDADALCFLFSPRKHLGGSGMHLHLAVWCNHNKGNFARAG